MKDAIKDWHGGIHGQDQETDIPQPHRKVELGDGALHPLRAPDGQGSAHETHCAEHPFINESRLADEDERDQQQKVFQAEEQGGIVPNFAACEEDGCCYEQHFVELKRGKAEHKARDLAIEEIWINRNTVKAVEQQRGAE